MALAGAVFLPAAGQRSGTVVTNVDTGTEGYHSYEDIRSRGKSVRLVRDAE